MPPLSLEEAMAINDACVNHELRSMGLTTEAPPSLAEYSLSTLIEARDLVRAQNEKGQEKLLVVCDDRLIAALYVAYN